MDIEIACRLTIAAIMLVGASIAIPFRRRADRVGGRVPRRADGPGFLTALVVIAVPMMLMPLCFVVHPPLIHWSQLDLPTWVRLGGAPIGAAALILLYRMFSHLGLNVTTTSVPRRDAFLVTTGPYRWIRHPMYAGGLMLLIAYVLLTASWVMAVLVVVASVTIVPVRIRREEANLVTKFGNDYRDYMKRTGRCLPRLRPSAASAAPRERSV